MGGVADGDLTKRTTHLICGEVQSLKYKVLVWRCLLYSVTHVLLCSTYDDIVVCTSIDCY